MIFLIGYASGGMRIQVLFVDGRSEIYSRVIAEENHCVIVE